MTSFRTMIRSSLLLLSLAVASAKQMELERIIMQLRSKVDSDRNEINSNIQDLTSQYLDDYFQAYYTQNQNQQGYFLKTDLVVTSLGVHGVDGSYITTLEMEGSLDFDGEPPSKAFVDTLLRNAFQGRNERIYLNELLASNSQFLRYMTHLFIEINDVTVAESEIERVGDDPVEAGETNVDSGTDVDDATSQGVQTDSGRHWLLEEEWAQITIYTAAGLLGLLLVIGCCCVVRCVCCPGSRKVVVDDDENELSDEPIKVVTLPVKNKASRSIRQDDISPTSQETERSGSDSDSLDGRMDQAPPSPERSLASQASSLFTFSKNNYASSNRSSANTSRFSIGSFSRFSLDMPSIDLGGASVARSTANPRGMQIPNFGHDISAIETHRDLSLIQEEDGDEEMGHHYLARAQEQDGKRSSRHHSSRRSYSSRTYESGRSRSLSKGRRRQPSPSSRFFGRQSEDLNTSDYSIDLDASSSDVIADLRNLSLQIQKQRKSRRAPDPGQL